MKYLRNAKPKVANKASVKDPEQDEMARPPPKKRKEFEQLPKVPMAPTIPLGEDVASHNRHVKVLQQEEKKMSPNKCIISDLMAKTYPFRRREILDEPQAIQQLLVTYPSLKRSEQVINSHDFAVSV